MHTVTIYPRQGPRRFDTGEAAYAHARTFKNINPDITVTVTDHRGNVVEIRENGWSRVNA